ncbi:hypothetical protein BOX15_Mlig032909g1 [Macrostomum lignano]|uniref:PH domain-containing protein n=2 Tax=Macrostomum lignano TaxID=282301 RepID=A0A267FRG9_9PLAT|nr:hypothetical protein BOX15_Mlig032909g1 [Macrostomum lignano]
MRSALDDLKRRDPSLNQQSHRSDQVDAESKDFRSVLAAFNKMAATTSGSDAPAGPAKRTVSWKVAPTPPQPPSSQLQQQAKQPAPPKVDGRQSNGRVVPPPQVQPPSLLLRNKPVEIVSMATDAPAAAAKTPQQALPPPQPVKLVDEADGEDDRVLPAPSLRTWDPAALLADLYRLEALPEPCPRHVTDADAQCRPRRGYVEKLPNQKKKGTLLKTWKRVYLVLERCQLRWYDDQSCSESRGSMDLGGGEVEDIDGIMIGVDDGRGRFTTIRCASQDDHRQWLAALRAHTVDISETFYVRPVTASSINYRGRKDIILIDIGSCSIRSGWMFDEATVPQVFIPSVVAVDRDGASVSAAGFDSFRPEVRERCRLVFPVRPNTSLPVPLFQQPPGALLALLEAAIGPLLQGVGVAGSSPVDVRRCSALVAVPRETSPASRRLLAELLLGRLGFDAVAMASQSLACLLAYGCSSGVVVQLGHQAEVAAHLEHSPVLTGCLKPDIGGHRLSQHLGTGLARHRYRLHSPTEQLLVRLALERSCYVSQDYERDLARCQEAEAEFEATLSLAEFGLPPDYRQELTHSESRFSSVEAIFDPQMLGLDAPALSRAVRQAVLACPVDYRRDVARCVLLCGGVSLLPGLRQRLETELRAQLPCQATVRCLSNRLHATYLGLQRLPHQVLQRLWLRRSDQPLTAESVEQKWTG